MDIDNRVSGKTGVLAVIGNPIEHSISPLLHNTISRYLGADLIYVPFRVDENSFGSAVKGLAALNVAGFNITIPYKQSIMDYLDDCTDSARLMGAVNTVKVTGGKMYGYNTDGEGFSRSFREETGESFKNRRVFILGAGGAARAVAVQIALEGAESIFIYNRTPSKAESIAGIINTNIKNIARVVEPDNNLRREVFAESDIIVNTTPVGMYPNTGACPLEMDFKLSGNQTCYDLIYNPRTSEFLRQARLQGCKAVNGLGMLFYQGIYAYSIWTGLSLTDEQTAEIFRAFVNI